MENLDYELSLLLIGIKFFFADIQILCMACIWIRGMHWGLTLMIFIAINVGDRTSTKYAGTPIAVLCTLNLPYTQVNTVIK